MRGHDLEPPASERRVRVGVVGAGISGLAAARRLVAKGHEVVVWERGDHVGGRLETRAYDGYVFDTGATSIAPRGMSIESVMLHELDTSALVSIDKPIYTHHALRVIPGDPAHATPRYTYSTGNATLPRLLAQGLDVRTSAQVEQITRSGHCFVVRDEAFDALILTPPIPQTSVLLWSLRESRPLANARYRPCLSVLLGFAIPTPETPYHALLDVEQVHPMIWLCLESAKSPGRAPEGGCAFVAQMSPVYSRMRYERPDAEIVEDVLHYVHRLYGDGFRDPKVAHVRRWKYSQPEMIAPFATVNRPGTRLIIAGDGLTAGRTEWAFESGVKAADLLIQR